MASDSAGPGLAAYLDHRPRHRLALRHHRRRSIDDTLYDAFGQRIVSTIFTQSNQYRVDPGSRARASATSRAALKRHLPAAAAAAARCRCSAIAQVERAPAPLAINHLGQFPAATLSFNLAPGVSLGEAVEAIDGGRAASSACRPASRRSFQGAALAFQASLANELLLILAALVTVYIVLGVLYESYIHPVTILSTLPSAGVGALLALMICRHTTSSVIALIGIILLIGIVKKNAHHDDRLRPGRRARRGQVAGARRSTRPACCASGPIMMTTMAALFGGAAAVLGSGWARNCAIRWASPSSAG